MNCRWFVEAYSEYRDGHLNLAARTALRAHMASCRACRRYDRVIRTGVSVLRDEFTAPGRTLEATWLGDRGWAIEKRTPMTLVPPRFAQPNIRGLAAGGDPG